MEYKRNAKIRRFLDEYFLVNLSRFIALMIVPAEALDMSSPIDNEEELNFVLR